MSHRVSVLGSYYSVIPRAEAQRFLLGKAASAHPSGYVCVSNVHTTMTGFFDPRYRQVTNGALLAVPDGMPLVWAMRSLGCPGQDRIRGPSLMRDLIDRGRASGIRHYLYGGSPETVARLKEGLEREYPGVLIVGAESPPFRPLAAIGDGEWSEVAERINRSGAQMLWVGLGAPKQELWMHAQRGRVRPLMFGIGAAFDLLSGRIPEAPALLQAFGLEWAYRLAREPRRLWRRYLFNNPAFLLLWAWQLMRRAVGKSYIIQ